MKIKLMIKRIAAPIRLLWGYMYDFRKFKKYSFDFNRKNPSKNNLRSEITFEYHAIEKGLSHDKLKLGFGKARRERLLELLNLWDEREYYKNDKRFLAGIAALNRYVIVHEEKKFDVSKLKKDVSKFQPYLKSSKIIGGEITCNYENLTSHAKDPFETFSASRRSIRNYGKRIISKEEVFKAINLATNYPSVCNRQAVKVHLITNINVAKECLQIQNGIQGMAENLSGVIIITCDNQYFGTLNERNQSFIDGGIFSMNILYALTYENIATCTLNANLNTKTMEKMKSLVNIPDSEDLIAFISYGSYPDICKFPVSNRDDAWDITSIIE